MTQFASTQLALTYAYEIILVTAVIYFTLGFLLYMVDRWQDVDIKYREKKITQAANLFLNAATESLLEVPNSEFRVPSSEKVEVNPESFKKL